MCNTLKLKEIVICNILIPSLRRLYQIDYKNIEDDVSERNICARLAHHMENIMREYDKNNSPKFSEYYVDVEYNRMEGESSKRYMAPNNECKYMYADLLIQSRGPERNYLAAELKWKDNHKDVAANIDRLKSLVSSRPANEERCCVRDTLIGAFIQFSKNDVNIMLFDDVNGKGERTGEINLLYDGRELILQRLNL